MAEPTPRYKGKFIKKKVLDQRLKAITTIREKKKLRELEKNTPLKPNLCEGRRIVELKVLGESLKCCKCQEVLSLANVVDEVHLGLKSVLTVKCTKCSSSTLVPTGKNHDANTSAVLGAIHTELSCSGLNKILECLNIPTISEQLFKTCEREVCLAMEKTAQESCETPAKEEQQQVNENTC